MSWIVNDDGTILISGKVQSGGNYVPIDLGVVKLKANTTYKLSGNPGASGYKYLIQLRNTNYGLDAQDAYGNGKEFTVTNDMTASARITIMEAAGTVTNLLFKPMLTLSSVTDSDYNHYVPYSGRSNNELTQDTVGLIENDKVNGCVNVLENSNTTNVQTETTFTVNDDGTVTVTVASTTPTPRSMEFPFNFKKGTYRLTGNPVKDSSVIKMTLYNKTDSVNLATDFGYGDTFTVDGTKNCSAYIDLRTGVDAGTYVFKPMISLASLNLNYDDYVPYSKSNIELTNVSKYTRLTDLTLINGYSGTVEFYVNTVLRRCIVTSTDLTLTNNIAANKAVGICNIPSEYIPKISPFITVPTFVNDVPTHWIHVTKNRVNKVLAICTIDAVSANEKIPFTLEWYY